MNKEEWEVILTGVLDFNRLLHSEEFRKTEEYYLLCCDLLEEECKEWEDSKDPLETLDAFCDITVTAIQAIDCVSPSQLDWDYCGKYLDNSLRSCVSVRHMFLNCIVSSLEDAEKVGNNIFGAMLEVIRSNNTKIPTLEQVKEMYGVFTDSACESARDWIEMNIEHKHVISYEVVLDSYGVRRVLFKNEDGKLMKWVGFSEAQLEEYL